MVASRSAKIRELIEENMRKGHNFCGLDRWEVLEIFLATGMDPKNRQQLPEESRERFLLRMMDEFTRDEMLRLLRLDYNEKHPYRRFDVAFLKSLVDQRGLKVDIHRKYYLARALEIAAEECPFQFNRLPPELRQMVYELAFADNTVAERYCADRHAHVCTAGPPAEHALTRTCRQIRLESLPLFYHARRFTMGQITLKKEKRGSLTIREGALPAWLSSIARSKLCMIRALSIHVHTIDIDIDVDGEKVAGLQIDLIQPSPSTAMQVLITLKGSSQVLPNKGEMYEMLHDRIGSIIKQLGGHSLTS